MQQISYFDMKTHEGIDTFRQKARNNLKIFKSIFGMDPVVATKMGLAQPTGADEELVQQISDLTGASRKVIEGVNYTDELLNVHPDFADAFGCTAVARNGVIGQNLDLFTVDLSVVREGGALYITMPTYLSFFGMNKHLAMCTNYLPAPVKTGVPVSQMRRNLLRCESIEQALDYLSSIKRTTSVNFLISDGDKVVDIEVSPRKVRVHEAIEDDYGQFLAHTNHVLVHDIRQDRSCSRLAGAVRELQANKELEEILFDKSVYVPIEKYGAVGFGSIVSVVMDPKNGVMRYKDPFMDQWEELHV